MYIKLLVSYTFFYIFFLPDEDTIVKMSTVVLFVCLFVFVCFFKFYYYYFVFVTCLLLVSTYYSLFIALGSIRLLLPSPNVL